VQGTIDKGPNHYAIAFAFQPGDNGVRISYEIPYGSNSASLVLTSPYDSGHMLVAAPPTVQVSSDGFQAGGTEQGYNVYTHDLIAAGESADRRLRHSPAARCGQCRWLRWRSRRSGSVQRPRFRRRCQRFAASDSTAPRFAALDFDRRIRGAVRAWPCVSVAAACAGAAIGQRQRCNACRESTRTRNRARGPFVACERTGRTQHRSRAGRARVRRASPARCRSKPGRHEGHALSSRTPPPSRHNFRRRVRSRARPHGKNPARSSSRMICSHPTL